MVDNEHPCAACANYQAPDARRRWNWHEYAPTAVIVILAVGGYVYFFGGQNAVQAQDEKRIAVLEVFKDHVGEKIEDILGRVIKIETIVQDIKEKRP